MQTSHLNLMRWLVGLVLFLFPVSMPVSNSSLGQAAPSTTADSWLNLQVSGQTFAFRAKEFYLTNATYALHVQFVDAQAVTPQSASLIASKPGSVPLLERVTYRDLWDGITLTYDAVDNGLARSSYRVEPGAAASAIRLRYNNAVTLNDDGTLTTRFATGAMTESAPVAWQEINGQRIAVAVAFETRDDTVGFRVGAYDAAYPLFIDPTLNWHTFLGGTSSDQGLGIAVDGSGNVYVAGYSGASWGSPTTPPGFGGSYDGFVAKLDVSGNLVWNTFLGGTGGDYAYAVAVDANGDTFVTGYSTATWGSPPSPGFSGGTDAFAAKLNLSGTLQWNTFLGGTSNERGFGIAADGSGNAYVTGYSWSADWPGCPADTCRKRAYSIGQDGFAAKLASDGSLTWNNFLGGTGAGSNGDQGNGIAVDGSGNVYVSGYSQLPWGSPVRSFTSGSTQDAFVAKFAADGTLTANTFLGGSGTDYGWAITTDTSNNVYVGGSSGTAWGSPVRLFSVIGDGYVAKLDSNLGLTWNTFVGGSGNDVAYAIAVDGSGNTFVTGYSNSSWGSPARPFTVNGSYTDAMVAKVASDGNLLWNTFLGGTLDDQGKAIAVDASGNTFVSGYSKQTWGSPVRAFTVSGTNDDAFAAKIDGVCSPSTDGNWNATTTWDCGAVPGTGDSVNIGSGRNVTLDVDTAVLNNVTVSGTLTNNGVAHTLSLTGTWNNSGTFTPATFIGVTFEGTGTQAVNGSTAFYNLTINNGVVFDLGTAGSASVNGTLTNNGTIRATRTIAATGVQTFDLAGGPINGAMVSLNITTDDFTSITLDRHDTQHPHFTGGNEASGIGYARYWTITPVGTGMVDITLPANFPTGANSKACRYTGGAGFGWECAVDSYTANTVTRNGVTSFSDWAAGNAGPTAVTVKDLLASSHSIETTPLAMLFAALLGLGGLITIWRRTTAKRITD